MTYVECDLLNQIYSQNQWPLPAGEASNIREKEPF
jgi:hypothetical protein